MTITDRQRQSRIAAAWAAEPDADLDTISATVDDALAAEAAERAEVDRAGKEMGESMARMMFRCSICGGSRMPKAPHALCDECNAVVLVAKAERAGAEMVNGRTRAELAGVYLDRAAG